jgi:hypothetical protein
MGTITKNAKITDYTSQSGVDYSTGNTLKSLMTDSKGAVTSDIMALTEGGMATIKKDTVAINADAIGTGTGSAKVKAGGAGSDDDPARTAGGATTVSTASTSTGTSKTP